jgi:voltage-gated potassium channel
MKPITQQNNFVYLFFSLVLFLFSAAIMSEFPGTIGQDIFSVVTILMLLLSLKSLRTEKTWVWAVYFLVVSYVVLTVLGRVFEHDLNVYLTLLILLLFFIGSFSRAVKQVLFIGDIDGNKIIGSLSLYMLLGLIWAIIYLLLLAMDPTAFSGIETAHWQQSFSRVAYYSFVTLTTLGYGDILPTNHLSEFFVYLEAIIGVFYMAIIVASLISLHLSSLDGKRREK